MALHSRTLLLHIVRCPRNSDYAIMSHGVRMLFLINNMEAVFLETRRPNTGHLASDDAEA